MPVIVAVDRAQAAVYAKAAGIKGKPTVVTPDNWRDTLPAAVPRIDVWWADTTWAFPPDMLHAIGQAIRAGNQQNRGT